MEPTGAPTSAPSPAAPKLERRVAWLGIFGIASLSLSLHVVYFLRAGPLFRDEAHEVNFSRLGDASAIWRHLWLESSPILYRLFLKTWSVLGESDRLYRLSGLLVGVALLAVPLVAFRRQRFVPVLTLAIPVLSPICVRQLGALRPYGLSVLFCALLFVLLAEWTRKPRLTTYVLAAVAGVLAVNTSYYACFFVLSLCLSAVAGAAVHRRPSRQVAAVLSLGVWPLLAVLPYVPIVRRAASWVPTQQTSITLRPVLDTLLEAAGAWTCWLFLTAFGVAAWVLARRWRAPDGHDEPALLGWITAPLFTLLTLGAFYYSGIPPTDLRFVPLIFLAALSLDLALLPLWRRYRIGIVLVVLGACLASFHSATRVAAVRQSNADLVAARVEALGRAGDVVLMRSWTAAISFSRYYHGEAELVTIPDIEDHAIHRYDLLVDALTRHDPVAPTLAKLQDALTHGHRVYMVGGFRHVPAQRNLEPLPPAPHPRYGWYKVPYLWNWEAIVSRFLERHLTAAVDITPSVASDVNPRENLRLLVASGWAPDPLSEPTRPAPTP